MSTYPEWPHCVRLDDEIKDAIPTPFVKYDIFIKDRNTCEFFIHLNGEEWRRCAEIILAKFEAKRGEAPN